MYYINIKHWPFKLYFMYNLYKPIIWNWLLLCNFLKCVNVTISYIHFSDIASFLILEQGGDIERGGERGKGEIVGWEELPGIVVPFTGCIPTPMLIYLYKYVIIKTVYKFSMDKAQRESIYTDFAVRWLMISFERFSVAKKKQNKKQPK